MQYTVRCIIKKAKLFVLGLRLLLNNGILRLQLIKLLQVAESNGGFVHMMVHSADLDYVMCHATVT